MVDQGEVQKDKSASLPSHPAFTKLLIHNDLCALRAARTLVQASGPLRLVSL